MASDKSLVRMHGKIADIIISKQPEMEKMTDHELKQKSNELKKQAQDGANLDDLLIDAYAVAREAARRVLDLNAYRVQLIGAIILHNGDVAEMKTGEGKTLTGLFPAYLNALAGKGVHIVTVNEYLSKRDSEINGRVYDFLDIKVGLNGRSLNKDQKRQAYSADITYTTNSELGFDYLRDNMVLSLEQKVQRGLNFSIIDEVDSVLIDESRTPLIISGGSMNRTKLYEAADQLAKTLIGNGVDVDIDLETKQVFLTESGIKKAEGFFTLKNLFDVNNTEIFHLIMNALKANFIFKTEVEYTVKDNQIVLIDQFTGRIMEGRAYSDGLHQALQAKEKVRVEEETTTMATITYQNFYRMYAKISGMTGTAKTEEEEFIKIYNMRVVSVPTNRPVIRIDEPDFTFATKGAMFKHFKNHLKELNDQGIPILIGTTSVESSEQIANVLTKANFKFEMINAKNHDREAEIVEKAGQNQAITLATNMAGRGTDIKLGEGIAKLGGLHVIGIERNEARRIDNQLRGRAGRQGDPGCSRFYITMEDDLMKRFASPKLRQMFLRLGDDHIKSRMFTRAITNAQKKLEGLNFDQRKNVLDYDNVLAQHREAMYSQRDDILAQPDLKVVIEKFVYTDAYETVDKSSDLIRGQKTTDIKNLLEKIDGIYITKGLFTISDFQGKDKREIAARISEAIMNNYIERVKDIPENVVHEMEKRTIIQSFDKYWTHHINLSNKLRSGIYLQQYAQNNPLQHYVEEASILFNNMKINIAHDVIDKLSKVVIKPVDQQSSNIVNLSDLSLNNQVTNGNQKEQQHINITDKDIEKILKEINIEFNQATPMNVRDAFIKLKENLDPKVDNQKIQELNLKERILVGFFQELARKRMQIQNGGKVDLKLSPQHINQLLDEFNIDLKKVTIEDVDQKIETIKKTLDPEKDKAQIQQLEIKKQILAKIIDDIKTQKIKIMDLSETANKNETEYIVSDETGKTKKRIKANKDGDIEDVNDSEQVQSQVKIG